jgi:hypothetical protein
VFKFKNVQFLKIYSDFKNSKNWKMFRFLKNLQFLKISNFKNAKKEKKTKKYKRKKEEKEKRRERKKVTGPAHTPGLGRAAPGRGRSWWCIGAPTTWAWETQAREAKGKKRKVYGPHCAGRRSPTSSPIRRLPKP